MSAADKRTNRYTGEKKNELRHGYGVYCYPNRYFRYEGEWENGQKHGHGKLYSGDGGYYEGGFVHGEIEGHGYKVFGISGAIYTGQFHRGEMEGQGLMRKPNGEQYEGSWVQNRMQGHGILTDRDEGTYEGDFHNNQRHGEGLQIDSNGDQYEGDWVAGKRHGHGILNCMDGTLYDGQWSGGLQHGEGNMAHASGMTYSGMWYNGKPTYKAAYIKMVGIEDDRGITVEQGKTFSIEFDCLDENGELCVDESGRSFKIMASWCKPKSTSRMHPRLFLAFTQGHSGFPKDNSQGSPIPAREWSVHSYDLLVVKHHSPQLPSKQYSIATSFLHKSVTFHSGSEELDDSGQRMRDQNSTMTCTKSEREYHTQRNDSEGDMLTANSSAVYESTSSSSLPSSADKKRESDLGSSPETRSAVHLGDKANKEFGSKEQKCVSGFIKPHTIVTVKGHGSVRELFLPPPEAYKFLGTKSMENVPSQVKDTSRSTTCSPKIERKKSPSSPAVLSSPSHGKKRSESTAIKMKTKQRREKYCLPGLYIVTLSEVTTPSYFGEPLVLNVEITVTPRSHGKDVNIDKLTRTRNGREPAYGKLPQTK